VGKVLLLKLWKILDCLGKVAVLADPSSTISHGSILGDKPNGRIGER
jgi:putative protein kinase ArgK-like GTPase of G3E family